MINNFYGKSMILVGLLIAVPTVILFFYPGETGYAAPFVIPASVSVIAGVAVCLIKHRSVETLEWQSSLQKGCLPVLFVWFYAFFAGAVPFVLGGQMDFLHALFETISGWTTVGLTVAADVESMPHIFLFHRAFMQFCGGIGFILMFAMFAQGKHSMSIYVAEGHSDRLMPSLKKTARVIFYVYAGSLVLGTVLYRVWGMGWFDAVCHTMTVISTSGFSTRTGSIGAYGSYPIEILSMFFMLVGATNFGVLFYIVQHRFKHFPFISEIRFQVVILLIFIPLAAIALIRELGMGIGQGFLRASFGLFTAYSTTGFSVMNYPNEWPPFALGLMIILMFIGGGLGSTAGGIKLLRVYLILRIALSNLYAKLVPQRHVSVSSYQTVRGKAVIDDAVVKDITGFVVCYFLVFLVGSLIITLTEGVELFSAMFETASALGTVGLSNGITHAGAAPGTLITLMCMMVLGRLEIFIVFIAVYTGVSAVHKKIQKRGSAHEPHR